MPVTQLAFYICGDLHGWHACADAWTCPYMYMYRSLCGCEHACTPTPLSAELARMRGVARHARCRCMALCVRMRVRGHRQRAARIRCIDRALGCVPCARHRRHVGSGIATQIPRSCFDGAVEICDPLAFRLGEISCWLADWRSMQRRDPSIPDACCCCGCADALACRDVAYTFGRRTRCAGSFRIDSYRAGALRLAYWYAATRMESREGYLRPIRSLCCLVPNGLISGRYGAADDTRCMEMPRGSACTADAPTRTQTLE